MYSRMSRFLGRVLRAFVQHLQQLRWVLLTVQDDQRLRRGIAQDLAALLPDKSESVLSFGQLTIRLTRP